MESGTSSAGTFCLPGVGEGLKEAEIGSWKVTSGDVVAVNDVLVEIKTARSTVELLSPWAGVVARLLVLQGQTVEVGTPLITIGELTTLAQGLAHQAIPTDSAGRLVQVKGFPQTLPTAEASRPVESRKDRPLV